MSIQYKIVTAGQYAVYIQQCKQHFRATMFLSSNYQSGIWGVVAFADDVLLGGWVGKVRGNKPLVGYFVKGVWFDSLPVLFTDENTDALMQGLINEAKKQALHENFVTLNVTHWSRIQIPNVFDIEENNASFVIDLSVDKEQLWSNVSSKLRNVIRKGEKTEVEVLTVQGEAALNYLPDFQRLRQDTQSRAIGKNTKASMLLKSNQFFTDLLLQEGSRFFIAKHEQEVVAMALMVDSGGVMYYFSGGSDLQANKKTGASSYLIWKAIERAKEMGMKYFDMGGVPVQPEETHPAYGVYFFKKSYGGVYEEYSSGKIILRKKIYPVLNFVLKNRTILRIISRRE